MACDNIHTVPLVGAFLARVPVRIWNKRSMNSSYEECRVPRFRDRLLPSVRLSARLSTRILAVSVAVRDELVGLGVAADRVLVRYNPRSRQVPALPGSAALFRQAHGISKREIVIATVGHAVPVKAWDILIPAFAKVVAVEPRARLILAGSFDAAAERACHASLKRQVTELGVSSKVIFTGRLNNVWPLLQATDIFTLPSRSEGWGNVLIEALDAGLPCVVTRVGAARQVVVEGINGILVDREDVEDLSRALLRLAQDDMLRRTMAYNASVPAYIPTVDEFAEQLTRDYESQLASIFSRRQTSPLSRSET
jgi:glycosyltransferase involved in cell wall biosynthesis